MLYQQSTSGPPVRRQGLLRGLGAMLVAGLLATMLPGASVSAQTTNPPTVILVSADSNSKVNLPGGGKLSFRDEDILQYDPNSGDWELWFDGSDNELGGADLEDFEVIDGAGSFIFTLDKDFEIDQPAGCAPPDELEVEESDVVLFSGGCYSLFLEGADIGLTTGNEDIDALACEEPDCSGRLLISTIGTASYKNGPSNVQDEDLVACAVPAGPCELVFDGSDIKLTSGSEDVDAAWLNTDEGSLWLNTTGNFAASSSSTSVSGDNDNVFGCAGTFVDHSTACILFHVFDFDIASLNKNIDGLWSTFGTAPPAPVAIVAAASSADAATAEADDAIDAADFAEAMSYNDPEVDAYDFINVTVQLFLPVVEP